MEPGQVSRSARTARMPSRARRHDISARSLKCCGTDHWRYEPGSLRTTMTGPSDRNRERPRAYGGRWSRPRSLPVPAPSQDAPRRRYEERGRGERRLTGRWFAAAGFRSRESGSKVRPPRARRSEWTDRAHRFEKKPLEKKPLEKKPLRAGGDELRRGTRPAPRAMNG